MTNENLHDVFLEQLQDVYSAEKQLTKALPWMVKGATSEELSQALQFHLEETQNQVQRLEKIFEELGKSPGNKVCKGMEGLIGEGLDLLQENSNEFALDAELITAAQRVEHYEIAVYGSLVAFAGLLGEPGASKLLNQTLKEEKAADEKLSQIARSINEAANVGVDRAGEAAKLENEPRKGRSGRKRTDKKSARPAH